MLTCKGIAFYLYKQQRFFEKEEMCEMFMSNVNI